MRQVLSLSFPPEEIKYIKNISKRKGFESVSSYIKHLVNEDKDLISEEELFETIKQGRKDYLEGKAVTAKSVMDLL